MFEFEVEFIDFLDCDVLEVFGFKDFKFCILLFLFIVKCLVVIVVIGVRIFIVSISC